MEPKSTNNVVLFDLDNTLFDHYHSLQAAISAIQEKYASLAAFDLDDLAARYNEALQSAYDKYLRNEIAYDQMNAMKVQSFFTGLGLSDPSPDEIQEFRSIYKPAYRASRRSTPGSIETLTFLRESGFRIGILSNGQIEDQKAKAEAIGLCHLVDRLITSEEVGCYKPDRRMFQYAIDALDGSPERTYMVGDSIDADVKGALDAGVSAMWYCPVQNVAQNLQLDVRVPVIHHMDQVLNELGIQSP